ncbi:hypothetical protein BJ878DRAFT_416021 [Calycina marina]|uniref:DUF5672 domain-containing protein n=1 Tax=Calycina marina TaxID=1763456 RepID=A0A9P8CHK8_9HELO|nr:hypothetical protein BJ878DRAFT_416021 [Calycina marina]
MIIGATTCAAVFILIAYYWWHTGESQSNLFSLLPTIGSGLTHNASLAVNNNFKIDIKVAAIIETRPLRALIPLISHFASVLGPEWPILFFTRASTVQTLAAFDQGSQPFRRMVKSGQIKIIELPTDAFLTNYQGIMDDYFEYDFVGAPHPYFREAFNGGLSLRNVSLTREVISKSNIAEDINNGTDLGLVEDVWFWDKMKPLGAKFPSRETAAKFSVDYNWEDRPLGYHGINKTAQLDRVAEIYQWCPEAYLAAANEHVLQLSPEELKNMTQIENEVTPGGRLLSFGQDS